MNKLYLSGPMSGRPEHNFPLFHKQAAFLRANGFAVINPAEMNAENKTWSEYLIADLSLMFHCDTIALLPEWETSKGARLELVNAIQLGLKVIDAITLEPINASCDLSFTWSLAT